MKRFIILTLAASACILLVSGLMQADMVYTPETENAFILKLKEKFKKMNDAIPQDRVYLQTDKTFYSPGETLWFSAYVVDASDMGRSQKSDVLNIQLISPKGSIENAYRLICKNGKAAGDFTFSENMQGGIYKIRAFTNWQKNEPDSLFFEKEITVQNFVVPRLKMKLDFDRKAYGAGDEVIAKLNLESNSNELLANYPFEYKVDISGKEKLRQRATTDKDGAMHIKFKLPENLHTNDGLLNIMLVYDGIDESISRSIPIVLNKISLDFYPEGGDLVEGIPNKIAFKALNEFGKPADVEGVVLDKQNNQVATFSSYHQGMGAFILACEPEADYTVKITKPEGINQEFSLPQMLDEGYVLNVVEQNSKTLQLSVKGSEHEQMSLIAQVRGKIYYSTSIDLKSTEEKINIPLSMFPFGVCQLTLFDSKGIARCERLVFVNRHKQLNVNITTDKEKYAPREKVTAQIAVSDENGSPVPARLSLSVSNDELLSFADDKQGNILSQLFLQQDLRGKIEEPAFYFTQAPKAKEGLDYVMLTNGWRRFKWEPVLNGQLQVAKFKGEKAILKATVIDNMTGNPMPDVKVTIGKQVLQTNRNGIFICKNLDIIEKPKLTIQVQGFDKYEEVIADFSDEKVIYLSNQKLFVVQQEEREMMVNDMGEERINDVGRLAVEDFAKAAAPAQMQDEINHRKQARDNQKIAQAEKPANNAPHNKNNKKLPHVNAGVLDKNIKFVGAKLEVKNQEQQAAGAQHNPLQYYRARVFNCPDYSQNQVAPSRTDFRKTVYWNPNILIDKTGKATISFYNNDEIASFKFIAEGIGANGSPAYVEKKIFTQLPFEMSLKMPENLIQDDEIFIPLVLKNNSPSIIKGNLKVQISEEMTLLQKLPEITEIPASNSITLYMKYKVGEANSNANISVAFNAGSVSDAFEQTFKIHAKGFPVNVSFSGKETNRAYVVDVTEMVKGSLVASATAYPSVVSDLMKGVESIFREPGGCFEQTSMSSYPNILVKDYLQTIGKKDPELEAKANQLIERGYKKLIAFETKEKGYEWFGGAPGHEALTAYGLMQFNDMKKVYAGVDQAMIDRTANWLMASKDGKGGYKRNARALDNFGGADMQITNAYITYALACAKYNDINVELDHLYEQAKSSKDAYILGLAANALFEHNKDKRAGSIVAQLIKMQEADGSFMGALHSITRSTHHALRIETTSLAIMAMLKAENINHVVMNNAVAFLIGARSGYGDFGNTQSTIMALKALTQYANYAKQTNEAGILEMYVDGKKVSEKPYKAGEREAIVISGLEKHLTAGKNKLELKYKQARNPLPYSIAVSWNTTKPASHSECQVDLNVAYQKSTVKTGETIRLKVTLENKTEQGLPSTMAIVGIPAGCSVQPWQLKELQDKKLIDYYEISGNKLNIYYRQMAPRETKQLNFDLKAEVKGKFLAPASCAYLYYTNEFKNWQSTPVLEVL